MFYISKRILDFLSKNWYSIILIILISFAIYWFGVRPVHIRKNCSVVEWIEPARLASANWPECENNKLSSSSTAVSKKTPEECYGPKAEIPAKTTPLITDANGMVTMSQTIPAVPAKPASANWPECDDVEKFDTFKSTVEKYINEKACYSAKPEERMKRKATDNEYKSCLRKHGI
jgi:hypothetical protein